MVDDSTNKELNDSTAEMDRAKLFYFMHFERKDVQIINDRDRIYHGNTDQMLQQYRSWHASSSSHREILEEDIRCVNLEEVIKRLEEIKSIEEKELPEQKFPYNGGIITKVGTLVELYEKFRKNGKSPSSDKL